MYYADNPNVIEASDIEAVATNFETRTLADGRQGLVVLLILSPHTGKVYGDAPGAKASFPAHLHVTDGANHRLLPFQPQSDFDVAMPAEEAASTENAAEESAEEAEAPSEDAEGAEGVDESADMDESTETTEDSTEESAR